MTEKLFTAFMLLLAGVMLKGAVIVDNGRSDYEIIVRKDAPQATQLAARELQTYLAKSSGVKLPLKDKLSPGKKALYCLVAEAAFWAWDLRFVSAIRTSCGQIVKYIRNANRAAPQE